MADVEFGLLGPVEVRVGGRPVPLTGKQQSLLALLLLDANRVVSTDRVADALWGDAPPADPAARVRMLVSELRRAVGAQLVVTKRPGYLVRVREGELDSEVFARHVELARAVGDQEQAVRHYDSALALWRGAPLTGVVGTFADADVVALADLRLTAVEERAAARLALGRPAEVVAELGPLTAEHPLRERLHELLMRALRQAGRLGDALAVYRGLRKHLADELGVEPSAPLRALHQRLLEDEPAPSRPDRPRLLPADVAGFVGRELELRGLDEVAHAARLVLVVGPPGVGKTATVVHWAHRVADRFPDGQLFLDLRGFDRTAPLRAADALARLLHVLGQRADETELDVLVLRYRSLLAGRRVLIVLDNVAEPEQVRPLLPGHPGCLVVLTSRDRLGGLVAVDGARRVTLDVLAPDAALTLIEHVAGAGRVRTELTAATELARLCGHLPLALRVASTRLADQPHQTVRQFADELADRGRLTRLTVDGDDRAGVRATFELSYRSLPARERRTFQVLGVVPGVDVATQTAAALLDVPAGEAADLLDGLARGHLVKQVGAGRFAWHDLLRDYAVELAVAEDPPQQRDAVLRRALRYFLHTLAAVGATTGSNVLRLPDAEPVAAQCFADATQAMAWLDAEWENVATAVMSAHCHPELVWRVAESLSAVLYRKRSAAEWLPLVTAGIAAARKAGEPAGEGALRLALARAHWLRSEHTASGHECKRALELFRTAGWPHGESAALRGLAIALCHLGAVERSIERFQASVAIDRRIGDRRGVAVNLCNLATVHEELGQLAESVRLTSQALPLLREIGHRQAEAVALSNLGMARHEQGRLRAATAALTRALRICAELGAKHTEAVTLNELGRVHRDLHRHAEAAEAFETALCLARDLGDRNGTALALAGLAGVASDLGRPDEAAHRIAAARAALADSDHAHGHTVVLLAAVEVELRTGAVRTSLPDTVSPLLTGKVESALAAAALADGRAAACLDHCTRAIAATTRCGQQLVLARTLVTSGNAHAHMGDHARAIAHWQTAHTLFTEIGTPDRDHTATLLARNAAV